MINPKLILNYSEFFKDGYIDNNLLFGSNWELFWNFSIARRFQLLFFPFEKDSKVLLLGDSFSALAGILLEKGLVVDSNLDFSDSKEQQGKYQIAELRFPELNIINIVPNKPEAEQYSHIILNLSNQDYIEEYLSLALDIMPETCRLLICAEGNYYNEIKKTLLTKKITKYQRFDPLCNGMLVIECSKTEKLTDSDQLDWSEYKSLGDGYYRSPLFDFKWIQKNGFPIFDDNCRDQDFDLIKDVKKIQLDLLRKLSDICMQNNIIMYPIYGTLLGLVRDGGYIEGDDDIDVALMREDYDKLLSLQEQFTGDYFLQTYANDDCFFGGYAKLRNVKTTAIHPQNWWADCCEGISIDIFPIDFASKNGKEEKKRLKKIRFYQRLLYANSYGTFASFKDMPLLKWKYYKYLGKGIGRKKMIEGLEKAFKSGDKSCSQLTIYTHYNNGQIPGQVYFPKSLFRNTVKLNYEGVPMMVPAGFDKLLKVFYGAEYNVLHEYKENKRRHGFYNVSVPYPVYKKRFGGLKHPGSIKEPVVLVGDGSVFKACLNYYNSRVNIIHFVLMPGFEKNDTDVSAITWKEFEDLGLKSSSYRLIICSSDVRYAEKVLTDRGINDYYIFYHIREWMLFANQSQIFKDIQNL